MSGSKKLLDTNIILYLLNGDATLTEFLQGTEAYVSIINELELIGYPEISAAELKSVKNFLNDCSLVGISEPVKEIFCDIRKKYKLKMGNAICAATAIYLNIPFVSADKDFKKVIELNLAYYDPS